MPDTKTFSANAQQLQNLADGLKSHGLVLDPTQPTGEAKQDSWDISWVIKNGEPDTIEVTVKSHPFGEESIFWNKLAAMLN